jgi:L-threonylcarbamoyladenylate synthase
VIVHIVSADQLKLWARDVPPTSEKLARTFWPGPLTLVLARAGSVSDLVTGGGDTVALRVPSHPLARSVLDAFQTAKGDAPAGLAAPSANRFGRVSPTTAQHVAADLGTDVDLVLDGGACEVGIESTIVDCSGDEPAILRPGGLAAARIEEALGRPLAIPGPDAPRAPGTLSAHYAPRAKVQLVTRRHIIDTLATNRGRRVAVLALEVNVPRLPAALSAVVPVIPAVYARSLYANLRALDAANADLILIEMPPETPGWAAVHDRLRRAAAGSQPKRR